MSTTLVLWDIDYTLLVSGPAAKSVYPRAFTALTGRAPRSAVATEGRTEPEIFAELLALHGVSGIRDEDAAEAMAAALRGASGELLEHGRRLPGAAECLTALRDDPRCVQSLLTGNLRPNARLKLGTFGLEDLVDFDCGAFGSDLRPRPELVPLAQRRAGERHGTVFGRENTVLLGDTLLDVAAGREGGARVVAVATGHDGAEELLAAGAEAVLPDLCDTGHVVETVLGGGRRAAAAPRSGAGSLAVTTGAEGGSARPKASGWGGGTRGPLVSVVVPARNAAGTLGRQLDALAAQDHPGRWEVVVVDDGSSDGTAEVAESRRHLLPELHVVTVRAGSGGVNRARNTGCSHSRGELLLFCDADDIVAPGWMSALVRALGRAPAAGGALERRTLNGPAALAARPPSTVPALADSFGFLKYPWGANCGVRRELWEELGGFDASYTYGSDDVEFFWRAQLAGAELLFAPDAVVHYQLRDRPWQMARQYYRYGRSHPMLYRRFGEAGMPRSSAAAALREWGLLSLRAVRPGRHAGGPAAWLVRAALRAGRLTGSLRNRVCYL